MKAVVYRGINDLGLEEVPEPVIESPTDALVKVTTSAICASDIHIAELGFHQPGMVIGHEYCGEIVDTGSEVHHFKKGDRVVGQPFSHCGHCFHCRHQQPELCENVVMRGVMGGPGVQAEYARVPYADNSVRKIPDGLADEDVIFVGDILSTGLYGVRKTQVGIGDSIGVFGCGPVGLSAVACATLLGAGQVIAVDVLDYRLDVARKLGAVTVNAGKEDAVARVKELTEGRGVDGSIEAAGFEPTFKLCMQSVRRGGRVCVLGAFTQPMPFDIMERFSDMLTLTLGVAAISHMDELIKLIQNGKLDLRLLITHTLPFAEAMKGYEIFTNKLENCIKVILKP